MGAVSLLAFGIVVYLYVLLHRTEVLIGDFLPLSVGELPVSSLGSGLKYSKSFRVATCGDLSRQVQVRYPKMHSAVPNQAVRTLGTNSIPSRMAALEGKAQI